MKSQKPQKKCHNLVRKFIESNKIVKNSHNLVKNATTVKKVTNL